MASVQRTVVLLDCCNGLHFDAFHKDVLTCNRVTDTFDVRRPTGYERPDVIVFGPYGFNLPPPGDYLRVGYICENYAYDGPPCDFVFTVSEQVLPHTPTARIQWHGIDPETLVKPSAHDAEQIFHAKTRFCNFVYSNRVPYREQIFTRLSKYKRVDAPGVSMRNMPGIDEGVPPGQSRWETKRQFLAQYKFTLALENEIFPGYQTEKLYDSMLANSMPAYVGDPDVARLFNPLSFVSPLGGESNYWSIRLRDFAQFQWIECHGPTRWKIEARLRRRLRLLARDVRYRWLMSKVVQALVDEIVDLDRDDDRYISKLREPWLRQNQVAADRYSLSAWTSIFANARARSARGVGSPTD
jgi:alpha(1,3/1,4) fucosyltransferase